MMVVDLVQRVFHLASKGEQLPLARFNSWLLRMAEDFGSEFIVGDNKYYWKIVSTAEFNDIIDEDDATDWFMVCSENREFLAMGKVRFFDRDLLGKSRELYLSSLWILRSDIPSIKVETIPISISFKHFEPAPVERLNYYFKQVMKALIDPTVQIMEYVEYKVNKSGKRRIR